MAVILQIEDNFLTLRISYEPAALAALRHRLSQLDMQQVDKILSEHGKLIEKLSISNCNLSAVDWWPWLLSSLSNLVILDLKNFCLISTTSKLLDSIADVFANSSTLQAIKLNGVLSPFPNNAPSLEKLAQIFNRCLELEINDCVSITNIFRFLAQENTDCRLRKLTITSSNKISLRTFLELLQQLKQQRSNIEHLVLKFKFYDQSIQELYNEDQQLLEVAFREYTDIWNHSTQQRAILQEAGLDNLTKDNLKNTPALLFLHFSNFLITKQELLLKAYPNATTIDIIPIIFNRETCAATISMRKRPDFLSRCSILQWHPTKSPQQVLNMVSQHTRLGTFFDAVLGIRSAITHDRYRLPQLPDEIWTIIIDFLVRTVGIGHRHPRHYFANFVRVPIRIPFINSNAQGAQAIPRANRPFLPAHLTYHQTHRLIKILLDNIQYLPGHIKIILNEKNGYNYLYPNGYEMTFAKHALELCHALYQVVMKIKPIGEDSSAEVIFAKDFIQPIFSAAANKEENNCREWMPKVNAAISQLEEIIRVMKE